MSMVFFFNLIWNNNYIIKNIVLCYISWCLITNPKHFNIKKRYHGQLGMQHLSETLTRSTTQHCQPTSGRGNWTRNQRLNDWMVHGPCTSLLKGESQLWPMPHGETPHRQKFQRRRRSESWPSVADTSPLFSSNPQQRRRMETRGDTKHGARGEGGTTTGDLWDAPVVNKRDVTRLHERERDLTSRKAPVFQ